MSEASIKRALVVEGGAMRGIFAAGVLDGFMAHRHYPFDFAVGVSAGATNLVGYLSNQMGRSKHIIIDHATKDEFINWRRFIKGGHLCDVSWLWLTSKRVAPLNLSVLNSNIPLWVTTTEVLSGQPRYFQINESNMDQVFTASCAVPIAYREFPSLDGVAMTDGGLADSIPVKFAYEQGARDITVISSRPKGYRKKRSQLSRLTKPLFRQHPSLYEAVCSRVDRYNEAMDFIESTPADCTVRLIAPPQRFPVRRFTRNTGLLADGYTMGWQAASQFINDQITSQ